MLSSTSARPLSVVVSLILIFTFAFTALGGEPCEPADINTSGAVDVDDLIAVILAWGPCQNCPATPCAADVNGNCAVDVDDLIAVILAWGPVYYVECTEITGIQPASGPPGTSVTITGSFPWLDRGDYCLVGMNAANDVVAFEVTSVTPTTLTAIVNPLPGPTAPVTLRLGLGPGAHTVPPAGPDGQHYPLSTWSWSRVGPGLTSNVVFTPVVTRGPISGSFFGTLVNGDMVLTITGTCPAGTELEIWPRVHHYADPTSPYIGYDAYIPMVCIATAASEADCATQICDAIRDTYLAHPGGPIAVDCTTAPVAGGTEIRLGLPGLNVDWGYFVINVLPSGDVDGDGIPDCSDNCATTFNPSQADSDGDGWGNDCDNCPATPNPAQTDTNGNTIGDACEGPCGANPSCPSDLNGDGTVDEDDIYIVTAYFGLCVPAPPCCGDVDGDGDVDADDLVAVILNYGPCPP